MRVFYATFCGHEIYDDRSTVVVAETESAALGWCLQYFPDTYAARWDLSEVDTKTAGVHFE